MCVILVKNNKGGVGKSWLSLQLGHRLATLGFQTLIITSDSQNNIADYAAIEKDFDADHYLEHHLQKGIGNFLEIRKNLYFIPFKSSKLPSELEYKFNYFVSDTLDNEKFNFIIIDGSPVLKLDEVFTKTANHIIIPTYMDNVTINSTTDFISSSEADKIRFIVPCRTNRSSDEWELWRSIRSYLEGSSVEVSEPIKNSSYVGSLINNGKTVWESRSKKINYIKSIIDEILEKTLEINVLEREYEKKQNESKLI